MEIRLDLGERPKTTGLNVFEPQEVYDSFQFLADVSQECLFVVSLTNRFEVISCNMVTVGTAHGLITAPREVFHVLIKANACAFIMIHNHPSGSSAPGDADDKVTEQMNEAGKLMEIRMIDHIIIGADGYHSYRETEKKEKENETV